MPAPTVGGIPALPQSPLAEATIASSRYVRSFDLLGLDDIAEVGGKNASLGELRRTLGPLGVAVPVGFALTAEAYRLHLHEAGLDSAIREELGGADLTDVTRLAAVAARLRERIASAPLPPAVRAEAIAAYRALDQGAGDLEVAVRSSATAEDLPEASFAGQQDTFLGIRGEEALDRAIRGCFASLFTDRAIVYRAERGFSHEAVALSVGVQQMVRSDLGAAGVIFTMDPESGSPDVILISGAWGLGELVVKGRVRPDEFWVHKATLDLGHRPILRRDIHEKPVRLVWTRDGATREEPVSRDASFKAVLSDDQLLQLARWARLIEKHYGRAAGRAMPMDIEWALDGRSERLYVLQARPMTVPARAQGEALEVWHRRQTGTVLVTGRSVGRSVGTGPVRVIHGTPDLAEFATGDVLVARMTDPDWEPVLKRAAAVVTDEGSRTCHAAIIARELGVPCVVGTGDATGRLAAGALVTVSCAEGERGVVYEGKIEFERELIDPAALPSPPVPLMLILADPDRALMLGQLPSAGAGLVRIEFMISEWIGIHPMAALHPDRAGSPEITEAILNRARGYPTPADFFVERLASGIAQIAAGFHPRPVIVRFSDFKSNEYAGLLGGEAFEPAEENPMLGFRGASRYYDERYREAFELECRAVRCVRRMGLGNVKVMIPFCRTLGEARQTLAEMERNGLARGQDGLEVYMMC
ncbi:MAG TPA: phosphoenolpyruvate synthase, partial [Gemmatimonadales bacterium]|nr:phosphoenolpyruvate synthase [Gemmatimonadales bacterium]